MENSVFYNINMPVPFILGALGYALVSASAATVKKEKNVKEIQSETAEQINNTITQEEKIKLFQRNLANLRILGDIKAESVADFLHVSRQAIWNLENGKSAMNATQYAAWLCIFLINSQPLGADSLMYKAVHLLGVDIDKYTNDEIAQAEKVIDQLARAKKAGMESDIIESLASKLPELKK